MSDRPADHTYMRAAVRVKTFGLTILHAGYFVGRVLRAESAAFPEQPARHIIPPIQPADLLSRA